MWWSFLSFFLCTLEGEIPTSLRLLCQQLLIFHCPQQQSTAQGHRVSLRCALVYKAYATDTWFAAEELIVSSSPSLNLFCLLLLQSFIPWPEPRNQHTDYWGLAISLCLCKRTIYRYWFDQTWNREWRTDQMAVKYTIWDPSTDTLGSFLGTFFPSALSVPFLFWKTLLSRLVEHIRCLT